MTVKNGLWMLPLVLLGTGPQLRAQNTVQVGWQNTPASILRDQTGKALPAGAPVAGDGAVVQLGYFSQATPDTPFEGTFVPLTGASSANTAFSTTAIGDAGGGADGRFSLSTVFQLDSKTSGYYFPPAGTPLAVRFFNAKTVAGSTHYNAVSGGENWRWVAPSGAPGEVLTLSMADPGLVWKGGPDSSLRTAVPCAVTFPSPPADQSVSSGQPATFRVNASGLEPLFYQWRKGGVPIAGATSPTFTIPSAKVDDAGIYDVLVANPQGSFRSSPAALKVDQIRGGFLIEQPDDLKAIRSTKAAQAILVQPDAADVASTQYQLLAIRDSVRTPVPGLSGIVPPSGVLPLSVRTITTAGDYVLHFKRTFKDGTIEEIDSEFFHIELKSWDDAAGTYEFLLEDVNHLPGDNARYRGALTLTLTRTGALSGRLVYVQAPALAKGEALNLRAYTPISRSFTTTFTPVEGSDLKFTAVPVLGTGPVTRNQDLLLELDASTTPPTLTATVRDHLSVGGDPEAEPLLSQGTCSTRALLRLPSTATGLAGNYTLHSENTAVFQVQVLPTARVAWLSRTAGVAGTGSASLAGASADDSQFGAVLTETNVVNSTSLLNTRSVLGLLRFSKVATGTWTAGIGTSAGPGALEKTSTYLAKTSGVPAYDALKFANKQNWAELGSLDFANRHNRLWTGALAASAPDFLKSGFPLLLKLHDPLAAGTAATHQWRVIINSSGVAQVTPLATNGVNAPNLSLRLDKTRAGITGQYMLPGDRVRRTVYGAAVMPVEGSPLRGQGWSEAGTIPSLRTGAWTLEPQP